MARTAPVEVRLLYFDDCPHWRVAADRLRMALTATGGDPDAVRYEQVTTPEQAVALGFHGSPTILVDGTDPYAGPDTPSGFACRVYRSADGVEPAPTVEQLQAVLER